MEFNIQTIYIVLIIPVFLAIMVIMEGLKNILSARNVSREGLDDETFISGRQAGCLGVSYILLGVFFLLVIGYVYIFLTK